MVHIWVYTLYTCYIMDTYTNAMPHDESSDNIFEKKFHSFKEMTRY